ncbi:CocE/NonD family hydrolase [Jatrophihabitans sp. DSM 45814]
MKFLDTHDIRSRFDERITMCDGIELSADIYRPAKTGEYPVLLTRTPYDNNRLARPARTGQAPVAPSERYKRLAACGFIVIACDVRGRGDSDGVFVPFVNEAQDGQAVLDWASAQPEANGQINTFGSGYSGFTALSNANHPAVSRIAVSSPFGAGEGMPARGGAIRLDWLFWQHLVGGRTVQPADVPSWTDVFMSRPVSRMDDVLGRADIPWVEWLEHVNPNDHFWSSLDISSTLKEASAPSLFISGWWDPGLAPTLRYWSLMRSAPAGGRHRIVVGPWDADAVRRPRADVGGVQWGPRAAIDPDEVLIDWFTPIDGEGSQPGSTSIFITGRNAWTDIDGCRSSEAPAVRWLSSEGRANTRRGDGKLKSAPVTNEPPDQFIYNPDEPVPWQPNAGSFARLGVEAFTLDTSFALSRDDVLVYTSEPLVEPMLICGRPEVVLWAETDAKDADWIVSMEDVFAGDIQSIHLAHGVVRAQTQATFAPNIPHRYEIRLTPVAHELLPNHAVRLTVTSSLFPLYAVNLGGEHYTEELYPRLARQVVLHDRVHRSSLTLPSISHTTERGPRRWQDGSASDGWL